jgi:hypothetical protein
VNIPANEAEARRKRAWIIGAVAVVVIGVPIAVSTIVSRSNEDTLQRLGTLAEGKTVADVERVLFIDAGSIASQIGFDDDVTEEVRQVDSGYCVIWSAGPTGDEQIYFTLTVPGGVLARTARC